MTILTNRRIESLFDLAMTVLGLVLVILPLALWIAWSESGFFLVLAAGLSAAALFCLLARFGPSEPAYRRLRPNERKVLPDRFVAELQRLFPLVYHHRRPGDWSFQRKMERLRKLLLD